MNTHAKRLTSREFEYLQLIAEGLDNGEIAKRLGVAYHTVRNTTHNIYKKIGAVNRTQAALYYVCKYVFEKPGLFEDVIATNPQRRK